MGIFTQIFKHDTPSDEEHKQEILQDLIRLEIETTRDIFGPLAQGKKRDFFCLDKNTWIWYEEWIDEHGRRRQMTTRYMVRTNEVLKSQNGGQYQRLSLDEARNFRQAAEVYTQKVKAQLYEDRHPARV